MSDNTMPITDRFHNKGILGEVTVTHDAFILHSFKLMKSIMKTSNVVEASMKTGTDVEVSSELFLEDELYNILCLNCVEEGKKAKMGSSESFSFSFDDFENSNRPCFNYLHSYCQLGKFETICNGQKICTDKCMGKELTMRCLHCGRLTAEWGSNTCGKCGRIVEIERERLSSSYSIIIDPSAECEVPMDSSEAEKKYYSKLAPYLVAVYIHKKNGYKYIDFTDKSVQKYDFLKAVIFEMEQKINNKTVFSGRIEMSLSKALQCLKSGKATEVKNAMFILYDLVERYKLLLSKSIFKMDLGLAEYSNFNSIDYFVKLMYN